MLFSCPLVRRLSCVRTEEYDYHVPIPTEDAMTSRERVQKAVNFQQPDRVPIDLGAMKASGIASIAYARLKKAANLPGPVKVSDSRFMIALVDEPVRERFHIDTAPLDWSLA